jgi:hypothetical protein
MRKAGRATAVGVGASRRPAAIRGDDPGASGRLINPARLVGITPTQRSAPAR